jgi:hypothetical protein
MAVINMSSGLQAVDNFDKDEWKCKCHPSWKYPTKAIRPSLMDYVLVELPRLGVLTITSAGNGCAPAHANWPSSNPYGLTVGVLDENGDEYEMSNYGGAVSLCAPGMDVPSVGMAPDQIDRIPGGGTSLAAPYVTGMAYKLMKKNLGTEKFEFPELRAGALESLLFQEFRVEQLAHRRRSMLRSKNPEENEEKPNSTSTADGDKDEGTEEFEVEKGKGEEAKDGDSKLKEGKENEGDSKEGDSNDEKVKEDKPKEDDSKETSPKEGNLRKGSPKESETKDDEGKRDGESGVAGEDTGSRTRTT